MRTVQQVRESIVDIATVEMRRRFMSRKIYSLQEILVELCHIFEVDIESVKSSSRHAPYVKVRRLFCFICSKITNYSLFEISTAIGGCEHSNALHHRNKAQGFMDIKDEIFLAEWHLYTTNSSIWNNYRAA